VYETLARYFDAPEGEENQSPLIAAEILKGLEDDFNTTAVLGSLFETIRSINKALDEKKNPTSKAKADLKSEIAQLTAATGLFGSEPKDFLNRQKQAGLKTSALSEPEIVQLLEDRKSARKAKDFKRSDQIRDELTAKGVQIKDNPDGTTSWEIKK
jgi:cysteinyl-tRNA synthetase